MSEWRKMTLGEFVSLQRGHDLTDSEKRPGIVPVIGSAGQNGYHDTALVKGPGVVIGRSGASFGQVHYCLDDYWPHNTGLYVTNFHGNNPLFAYYYLKSTDFNRYNSGSAQPSLNRNFIYPIEVKIPCLTDQCAIARILGTLDDKIELNRQINQTLEHIAQAMFKSWFVDFEPVKAKIAAIAAGADQHGATRAAMRTISGKTDAELDKLQAAQPERYLELQTTADLFPAIMQPSELGEIPAGWDHVRLDVLVELAYGKAMKKTDRIEGSVPVYGSGGITGSHNEALVEGPGIIIGRKGTVGSLYWEDNSFYPIDTVFYVLPKSNTTLEFSYYLLQTLGLSGMNTDAAVPGLNRNNVYRLEVPDVPDTLKIRFARLIQPLKEQTAITNIEIKLLEDIRNSLLPKLLSGAINLDHIESENG